MGLIAGLAAFDDATNSYRKVWTTALLSAAGGAVGGYFLGQVLEKRPKTTKATSGPNAIEPGLMGPQWSALHTDKSRISSGTADLQFLATGSNPAMGSEGMIRASPL
jgi:hypothetical protein